MTRLANLNFIRKRISKISNALLGPIEYFVCRDSKYFLLLTYLFGLINKHVSVLPIEWLDENKTGFKETLEPEEYGYSYGPSINGYQTVKQVTLPAIKVYRFENARVTATSSSVLTDKKIIIERVEGVDVKRCSFSSGHVFMHGQRKALVINRSETYLDRGIFLGGNGSFNYYHWIIEILPKLKYLEDLDEEYQNFPLLVSDDVDHTKTFREALDYCIKYKPSITLNKKKTYLVGKLLYLNAPNNLPFNLRRKEKIEVSDFLTRASSVNFLRNRLCADLTESRQISMRGRLFFARQTERRNYNQEEIFEIFRLQGFQKVFMEELTLRDQIELVSNAEVIAGPTGAAWTNLIFCREGTKCLCWMADESQQFSAYSNLAKIVGADLRYVTYKTEAKSTGELYTSDYHVDPQVVEKGLEGLLNTVA